MHRFSFLFLNYWLRFIYHYIYILHLCHAYDILFWILIWSRKELPSWAPGLTCDLIYLHPDTLVSATVTLSQYISPFVLTLGTPYNYIHSLCRGHSWRVRLAKQETLTPPGNLVSPLVCRGPWITTVVLYRLCHIDSASVFFVFYI